MADTKPDWEFLLEKVSSWLKECQNRLQATQAHMTVAQSKIMFVALYCLRASQEYFASAFESYKANRFRAGLACCRPVAEMAIIFLWCLQDAEDPVLRTHRWAKDTHWRYMQFLEELSQCKLLAHPPAKDSIAEALELERYVLRQLASLRKLPNIKQMLESIDGDFMEDVKAADLYPMLYRFLSSPAHADFRPEYFFKIRRNHLEDMEQVRMDPIVPWVTLSVAWLLVAAVFKGFRWDHIHLRAEYEDIVEKMHPDFT